MTNPADMTEIGNVAMPQVPYPLDDDALDALLQGLVTACTGLSGDMVRPRWQTDAIPKTPLLDADWCAIGVLTETPDAGPSLEFDGANELMLYSRHLTVEVTATFYGLHSGQNAALLRDGLAFPRNTDVLRANDMAYVGCGPIINAPELRNQQWLRRRDVNVTLRRRVSRNYGTLHIAVAAVHLIDDTTLDDTILIPPGSPLEP